MPVSGKKRQPRSKSVGRTISTRRLFTVQDDAQLLEMKTQHPEFKNSKISKLLSPQLGRSTDSIRDRLRKILNKLPPEDITRIKQAAKVIF